MQNPDCRSTHLAFTITVTKQDAKKKNIAGDSLDLGSEQGYCHFSRENLDAITIRTMLLKSVINLKGTLNKDPHTCSR